MTTDTRRTLDRPDPTLTLVRERSPGGVEIGTRGALDQWRDRSGHRRFTWLYDDLLA